MPLEDRIGEEGRGFDYMLHGMNPERVLIAAEAIGLGKAGAGARHAYAKERIVFDRPIGKNQAIQHPLAEELDGARGGVADDASAAWQYDQRQGRAARRPMRPSISPAKPASRPASRP